MSWGTYINTVLVPGVAFADVAKRAELAKTIGGLRTEALAHAAVRPADAASLAREYEDWKNRFVAAIREDAALAFVERALDDRQYENDETRWPEEMAEGVLVHDAYYNRISRREILDCELDWEETPPWHHDEMLALWGLDPAIEKPGQEEPPTFGDLAGDVVREFRERWESLLDAESTAVRLALGKAALEKDPEGYEEG